jgi:putative SOS response-associated peptidase YedK
VGQNSTDVDNFTRPEGSLLAFAGLWDKWRQPDGTDLISYAIITTAPNDFVARFHDRMPVILDERDYGRWLHGGDNPQDLLKACHNEALYNYPVSRQVNSVRNNDPSLVVPLESEAVRADHPAKPA